MGKETGISWCDHTFNPWWGCTKVDALCKHCYADSFAQRTGRSIWGIDAPRRFFGDTHWGDPNAWNAAAKAAGVRRLVFCASMCDVFEDRDDLIPHRARLWELISKTTALDWLLLTKRPENFDRMLPWTRTMMPGTPWPNVRLGVSAGTQHGWDTRVDILARTAAAVRFVSAEPLLEHVNVNAVYLPRFPDQVIIGGESGAKRRPMELAWMEDLANDATANGAKVFIKQDVGPYPGQQGRIPADLWARKEIPRNACIGEGEPF